MRSIPRAGRDLSLPALATVSVAAGCIYFLLARAAGILAIPHTAVSPIGPEAGVAVATLIVFGYGTTPALASAAVLANIAGGLSLPVSVAVALVCTAEYLAVAHLLQRCSFQESLETPRDIGVLVIFGVLACPLVASFLGSSFEWAVGIVSLHRIPIVAVTWWVGDGTGILILVPTLLACYEALMRRRSIGIWTVELVVSLVVFAGTATVNFLSNAHITYLLFAFGTLIAIRSRTLGAFLSTTLLWAISIPATAEGFGPFVRSGFNNRFLQLETLAASFGVMVFALAASANDRIRSERQIRSDKLALEAQLALIERIGDDAARDRAVAQEKHDRLQSQLHRALRLESLGQLTGGIAHDFNNLLGVITNYASYVARKLKTTPDPPGDPGRPDRSGSDVQRDHPGLAGDVDQILLAAERGSRLTKQLLAFARQEKVDPDLIEINEVVRAMTELLQRTIGTDIRLVVDLAADPISVIVDQGQLEQVLVNLAINARDAMPGGGELTIGTDIITRDAEEDPLWTGGGSGEFARISVVDRGIGMPEEVVERAFDPFFSTKPVGEGTGLGLATVYGIVTGAGGQVRISSSPGSGTEVVVLLPLARSGTATGGGAADEVSSPAAGHRTTVDSVPPAEANGITGRTVMVVEDEPAMLEMTLRILSDHGAEVLSAPDGTAAIEVATVHADHIDLLLTDVIMPGLSGRDVARHVFAAHPEIRVVYMSGNTSRGTDDETNAQLEPLLSKPFDEEELMRAVTGALSGAGI